MNIKTNKTVKELEELGIVHRYKQILANGKGLSAPQREGEYPDEWDTFYFKDEYKELIKSTQVGLMELDQCLNFCQHFVREKGNIGAYERDGKRYYPVDGTWCGIHDYGGGESGEFFKWVIENFGKEWYELMDRYK